MIHYLPVAQLHQKGKVCALFLPFHACHDPEHQEIKLGTEKILISLAQSCLCSLLREPSWLNKQIEVFMHYTSCLAEIMKVPHPYNACGKHSEVMFHWRGAILLSNYWPEKYFLKAEQFWSKRDFPSLHTEHFSAVTGYLQAGLWECVILCLLQH